MKLIIDTDAGCDDAAAILLALSHKDVEIVAITTVHGNTNARQVGKNVLRILDLANRLDIPVYSGCENSLIGDNVHAASYHGKDGLGDVPDENQVPETLLKDKHASVALVEYAKKYAGEISLICMAPLTNIAVAMNLSPNFDKNIKDVFIMGGNIYGQGNATIMGEFNFVADPEAAYTVLNGLNRHNLTICPWELCLKSYLSWDWYRKYSEKGTKKSAFMKKVEKVGISNDPEETNFKGYVTADQTIMAVALNPKVVKKDAFAHCSIELSGKYCRGQMIVDWRNVQGKTNPKFRIIEELDLDIFSDMLEASVL
ncbi:DgyrCDS8035 [Dimorphilus gyrociliatus]|uniref:DgyrCDS8035 n=1 Tax=Dimorphilus gyrociliatus TaxID=2664684 RepID=A0A7I8VT46_9ANNE|nr:DgyrCDS8035 [Dimorphilus gyrociliatus]